MSDRGEARERASRPGTPERGALLVVAAPSGAGKTTLVHALIKRRPELKFSISHTTRKPRPAERSGVDYIFVDEDEFRRMADAGAFLEHARVFDHWYGTGKDTVEALRAAGHSVLLEIDWQGARQVRAAVPDATTVFILPPSLAELERRLRGRGTDSEAVITRRLKDSVGDMGHWNEFDHVVVNEDVAQAVAELEAILDGRGDASRRDAERVRGRVGRMLAGRPGFK
jgi:guanylate kinase